MLPHQQNTPTGAWFSCGGYLLFCPLFGIMLGIPERIFARLMDIFVWVDRSLSSQLTLRMVLKALRCLKPSGGDVTRTCLCVGWVRRRTFKRFASSPPVLFALLSRFCGERTFCALMWRTLSPTPPASRLAPGLTLRSDSSPFFALVHGFALGALFCFEQLPYLLRLCVMNCRKALLQVRYQVVCIF